jgi:HD-GYP domain-containing protein (c-di-GMP phosphodiesterase class II)
MPAKRAIEELRAKSGSQFDADIVEIFISDVLKAGGPELCEQSAQ